MFGFHDAGERACFDLLLTVQGVGPQVALALCSAYGPDELQHILLNKDIAALTKVKGVGRKSAERITLELSDKAEKIPVPLPGFQDPATPPANQAVAEQVRQGLVALGYGNKEAERAIAAAQADTSAALTAEELLDLPLPFYAAPERPRPTGLHRNENPPAHMQMARGICW